MTKPLKIPEGVVRRRRQGEEEGKRQTDKERRKNGEKKQRKEGRAEKQKDRQEINSKDFKNHQQCYRTFRFHPYVHHNGALVNRWFTFQLWADPAILTA